MLFQIVSPVVATIDGDTVKDAVKNFIKLNYQLNLAELIIKDQNMHMNARINYYQEDGRNKVGINVFPRDPLLPIPIVSNTFNPLAPAVSPVITNFEPLSTLAALSGPSMMQPLPITQFSPLSSPTSSIMSSSLSPFFPSVITISKNTTTTTTTTTTP